MKVQAAVLRKHGGQLEIEELELRKPTKGEVVVKLKASSICHTDLSVQNGAIPFFPLPIVLGHEGIYNYFIMLCFKKKCHPFEI